MIKQTSAHPTTDIDLPASADDYDLYPIDVAYRRLGISRAGLYNLLKAGKIRTVNIGRRSLVPRSSMTEFLHSIGA